MKNVINSYIYVNVHIYTVDAERERERERDDKWKRTLQQLQDK